MVAWLGIFIMQNILVHKGELAIHRKLGWFSAVMVVVIAISGIQVGYHSVAEGRLPPFFAPAYFLALTSIGSLAVAGMVAWAVAMRGKVQWHRRLMRVRCSSCWSRRSGGCCRCRCSAHEVKLSFWPSN